VNRSLRVAVLGAGNWGVALAQVIAGNGHRVLLWTRDRAQAEEINRDHHSERQQPELVLAPQVHACVDLSEATTSADLLLMVVPSQAFRSVCQALAPLAGPDHVVVSCAKGLEAETHLRMTQVLMQETCVRQVGVLSGPNIANEIARGKPAGTVIATRFPRVSSLVMRALACPQLRVFESSDVCGVELLGALKNVIAIGAGMAEQLELGDNAKALLVTRGLSEMMRLVLALGAEPATTAGLAGIGDLMVTCASPLSRNHRLGAALARGDCLDSALERIGMVAEGVYASRTACELAKRYNIELPVFEHIHRVLHDGMGVHEALSALMELPTGHDLPHFARGGPR
jgi:glycerol-3-phosphate dehydrogenase (NAD(P)+)